MTDRRPAFSAPVTRQELETFWRARVDGLANVIAADQEKKEIAGESSKKR
jgi:hypothetical protein